MVGSFCWQDEVLWECTQGFRNEPFGPSQPPVRTDREVEAHAASPVSRGAGWGGVAIEDHGQVFFYYCCRLVTQSCLTLCDSMD